MLTKPFLSAAMAALLVVLLSACDSGITMHEPGVYKGGDDPLASPAAADKRSEALTNRANRAFRDR
jgi:ABC-type oligopeptide transport system substrate-binding subunit